MSEIKLNLTDAQHTLNGTIHGSIADACVAALSAEPETIPELEAALARFINPVNDTSPFAWFRTAGKIDTQPWDAGMVIIDLAARIVASNSTYSQPGPQGEVRYHDGVSGTDIPVLYRLPDDWLFLNSIAEYECLRERRGQERAATPPLDAREILYGRPLLEWVLSAVYTDALSNEISAIHARWLTTPRDDLQGQSPRDVLLANQGFIDFDLHTRSLQWSLQGEGPPCLATDSFAYRFAGFGTHEWVVYYDLVRYLLWSAVPCQRFCPADPTPQREYLQQLVRLEQLKTDWLERPREDFGGKIPALIIENERIRLPIAMRGHDMVIDDDCPVCQMMGDDTGLGMEVAFWHLDGSHMDEDFAFSSFRTRAEWEADRRQWQDFKENFDREWEEREQRERRAVRVRLVDPIFNSPDSDPNSTN